MLLKQQNVRVFLFSFVLFYNNRHQYNTKIPVFKTKAKSLEEMG